MSESQVIEGREACIAAWREALVELPERGVRTVWCIDADFAEWPFDDAAVLDALLHWAKGGARRTVHFVAADYAPIARRHPRLSAWRRDWSHCIQAWQPDDGDRIELPCLLVAGDTGLEMLDAERWRARRATGSADVRRLVETSEAIAQRCSPGWPATVLGL
jgi:hypothetical protein